MPRLKKSYSIKEKKKRKKRQTRSSFDISKDVVEHREQNNNSSVPAGAGDLSVHTEQVER